MFKLSIDILVSLSIPLIQPPIGIATATSIRVGNELGAGNPNAAKKASYFAIVCVCKSVCPNTYKHTL